MKNQAEKYWPEPEHTYLENNVKVETDKEMKELLPKF
jgi:hypothetical protein